jgi:hypothetical protein
MPTMPGELLHEADLAVGKVGVIRGVHGPPPMNGARETRSSQRRPFCRARRAQHPGRPCVAALSGLASARPPERRRVRPHELSSRGQEEHATTRRRVMPTSSPRNPRHRRRLSDASA